MINKKFLARKGAGGGGREATQTLYVHTNKKKEISCNTKG
jgi:DNA-dependent RNA polymerase auxiliary subunit epsilon